jgi:hypothetical protein
VRPAIISGVLLAGYCYARGWTTQQLVLQDGRSYEMLNWDRHLSITVDPGGTTSRDTYFWVRYYSNYRSLDAMTAEAKRIAPQIWQFADSLRYTQMKVEPTYPLLFRHFPILTFSTTVWYTRDSAGTWHEGRAKHGS